MRFLLGFLPFLLLLSCGGNTSLDTDEGIQNIRSTIVDEFGADLPVYRVTVNAEDHLTNEFGSAAVYYLRDGNPYTRVYILDLNGMVLDTDEKEGSTSFLEDSQGSMPLGDIDFSLVNKQYQAALAMIPEEYENHTLNSYYFNIDNDNVLTTDFTVEATEVGEDSEMEGLTEVISYYEFEFEGDAAGNVTADD